MNLKRRLALGSLDYGICFASPSERVNVCVCVCSVYPCDSAKENFLQQPYRI